MGQDRQKVKAPHEIAIKVSGIFIPIGLDPNTTFLNGALPLNDERCIIPDGRMETELPEILAAGDSHSNATMQTVLITGGNATAVSGTERLLNLS